MQDDEPHIPGLPRPSQGLRTGGVIVVSMVTSVLVSVGTVLGLGALRAPPVTVVPHAEAPPRAEAEEGASLPDFVRMPIENALTVLEALHIRLVIRERRPDPVLAAEVIASQTPAAGTRVHGIGLTA